MTSARLVPSPADGHGLTETITSKHFAAYTRGERTDLLPALVLLKVHGQTSRDTANGRHSSVQYEVVKLEPVTDPDDRDDAMWTIQSLYEARTSTGEQRPLPLGLANEERRQALMERIEKWSADTGLTGVELEQRWRESFGIDPDDPDGNIAGVPGDYRKASVSSLLQFAIEVGAEPKAADQDDEDDEQDIDD